MKRYDDIVVGSGISGLTAALLLARGGRRVLVLEKAPRIGGSLSRFSRQGVPFDTGFHFTGAFQSDGILYDMLSVLGIRDAIRPIFLPRDHAHRFVFEATGASLDLPSGAEAMRGRLKEHFPAERMAIDRYMDRVAGVCRRTTSMNLRTMSFSPEALDEDFVSLQAVLDELTANPLLKACLAGFCMCYGVRPADISFANHSRICMGLYESVARVEGGGESFVGAFEAAFAALGVEVRTGTCIRELAGIENDQVTRFVLESGEEVQAGSGLLTIHPREILKLLPARQVSRAFVDRVEAFEPSSGFVSVFGVVDGREGEAPDSTIVSLFPDLDMNRLLDPAHRGDSALVVLRSVEQAAGRPVEAVTAFEPSFFEQVSAWADSRRGRRPPEYLAFKRGRVERIRQRLAAYSPVYRDRLRVLDAATPLTFRDYLNSPDGSAYGIKQKIGQFNLFGKLPLRNLYAAGQSAVLPGLVGAMVSSFIVTRAILGKDAFSGMIERRLMTSGSDNRRSGAGAGADDRRQSRA